MKISLAISTCPNDTYIFGAMLNSFIPKKYDFDLVMDDVEVLNNLVLRGITDISKISFGVYPKIKKYYKILSAGAALGFSNGPLIISKKYKNINELRDKVIAIPGQNTTANLLLSYFYDELNIQKVELRFDKVIPAVVSGEVDAGLIIHEGRFIYKNFGLELLADLGVVWHERFGLPLPLGCIVIKNQMAELAPDINNLIRQSITYADNHYDKIAPFIKKYAAELSDEVVRSHIDLYVNKYSIDMREAASAMTQLLNINEDVIV